MADIDKERIEKLIQTLKGLTVEDKLTLFNVSGESAEIREAKMIIAIDLKANHISDSRVEKALNNAMREDSQIRDLLTSEHFSSEKTSKPRRFIKVVIISTIYLLMTVILPMAFIFCILFYLDDANHYNSLDFAILSFIALSFSLPFLLSKLLNIIRYKTEDTGRKLTSYYSGPHILTQAEVHGDEFFKKINNSNWRKYYIIFLLIAFFIPIFLFLLSKQNISIYIIILCTIISPLSFLAPQLIGNNFLISEEEISQDYVNRMRKISVSFSRDILFGLILPVLAIYCIYYSLSDNKGGLLTFLCLESIILFIGGVLYSIVLKF